MAAFKYQVKLSKKKEKYAKHRLIHEESKKHLSLASAKRGDTEVASIMQWMINSKIFPQDISKDMLKELCVHMENRFLKKNDVLFLQEDKGDCFYIIIEGAIMLYLQDNDKETLRLRLLRDSRPKDFKNINWSSMGSGAGKSLKEMPSGLAFGELSLLHDEHSHRSCSAICSSDMCQLCVIDSELYNRTLRTYHQMNEKKDVVNIYLNYRFYT